MDGDLWEDEDEDGDEEDDAPQRIGVVGWDDFPTPPPSR